MIKRVIASFLTITMLLGVAASLISCSAGSKSVLTVGQWLMIVNEAFGMQSYTNSEPYFKNVQKEDPYFEAVQIAAEWDVIDKNKEIDTEANLKWKDALLSLVNVGNFASIETSEEEKIDLAISTFDSTIRKYWMKRNIDAQKAVELLSVAQNKWATKEYDHVIEETKYKEGVVDLSSNPEASNYMIRENVVVMPKTEGVELKEGDVYVLPGNENDPEVQTNKVKSITSDDEYIYITNSDEELTLEDIAEDIHIEETYVPTAENAIIYDGDGNIISVGNNISQMRKGTSEKYQITTLGAKSDGLKTEHVDFSNKHTFKAGDWEVSLSYKLNGSLDFGVEVTTDNMLSEEYQKAHPSQELKATFAAQINKFKVTNDIDYKFFKLKSASLRVDYEQQFSGSLSFSGKPVNKFHAPKYQNYSNFSTNWANTVLRDANCADAKGAKTIKICSVDLYTVGIARVCLDINFVISAEGSASLSLTIRGAKGIEYKNGNIRLINTTDKDFDLDIKAKIEATIGIGPALYAVGLKKPIIGLQVNGGLGAAFNAKFNLVDTDGHLIETTDANQFSMEFIDLLSGTEIESDAETIRQVAESQGCTYTVETNKPVKLHFDRCAEGSLYFILRASITDTSYIASLLEGKITMSWDICNAKNAKLLNVHCDNGDFRFGYISNPAECTLKYVPFDKAEDTDKADTNDSEYSGEPIIKGDSIILEQMYTSIEPGKNAYIQLSQIPKGYEASDIVCSSSNADVATVNNDGVITAKKEGSAIITVATKDKKYTACMAVTVTYPYTETKLAFITEENNKYCCFSRDEKPYCSGV